MPCSFEEVANITFDTALEKEVMVSWHYGSERFSSPFLHQADF